MLVAYNFPMINHPFQYSTEYHVMCTILPGELRLKYVNSFQSYKIV